MRGNDGDEKIRPFRFSNFFAWLCKFIWTGVSLRPPDGERPEPRDTRKHGSSQQQRGWDRRLAHAERPARVREAKGRPRQRSAIGKVERTARLSPRHAKRQHEANDRAGESVERQAFVHRFEALAVQGMSNEASRVEGRVLERSDGQSLPVVGMRPPRQTPSGRRKNGGRRRAPMFEAAMAIESERER
jgi:hypothetical protein